MLRLRKLIKELPLALAFASIVHGVHIFGKGFETSSSAPAPTTYLFAFGVSILLKRSSVYPGRYMYSLLIVRQIFEYFFYMFVMELSIALFWYKLADYTKAIVPRIINNPSATDIALYTISSTFVMCAAFINGVAQFFQCIKCKLL